MAQCFNCNKYIENLKPNQLCKSCYSEALDDFRKLKEEYEQLLVLGFTVERATQIILKRAGLE